MIFLPRIHINKKIIHIMPWHWVVAFSLQSRSVYQPSLCRLTLTAENTNGYLISLFYCHSCFPPYHMHNTSTTKTAAFHSNHMKTIKGNWNITKRNYLSIHSEQQCMESHHQKQHRWNRMAKLETSRFHC